jgi:hypothetical protein
MLELLPDGIVVQICLYLEVDDVVHISKLSKVMYRIASSARIWENYFQKNYRLNYQLIKKLEGRNRTETKRNWKLDFLKKFTERRCVDCGFVYNCFNRTLHSHAQRTIKKAKTSNEKLPLPIVPAIVIPQAIIVPDKIDMEILIMEEDLILKDFTSYVYRRKSKYLKNTEGVTAKRSLFV